MTFDPHERLVIDGERMDANIASRVTACTRVRTMDGAASLEVAVHDPDMELLRSGALVKKGRPPRKQAATGLSLAAWDRFGESRLTIDGWRTRLAGVQYDLESGQLLITWEDEIAAVMRRRTDRVKYGRREVTRAHFISFLATQRDRRLRFPFFSPQEDEQQPIHQTKDPNRQKGIAASAHVTVKNTPADAEQRRHMETSLREADAARASERATIAMLCAAIGESDFRAVPNAGGSNYWGVFQGRKDRFAINDTAGMARCFLKGGKGYQEGGAIAAATAHPDWSAGTIAYKVEGSRRNFASDAIAEDHYGKWENEAQAILAAWGGVSRLQVIKERFEFVAGGRRGGKLENHWDGARRLGTQISGWRLFADENALWYQSDEYMIRYRPRFIITASGGRNGLVEQGVTNFSLQADVGIPVAELRFTVQAARGTIPAGCVFQLDDFGPVTGRWLMWECREDYMAPNDRAEVTLQRPAPTGKEPAAPTQTRTLTESAPEAGTLRGRILEEARKTMSSRTGYSYYLKGGTTTTDPTPKPYVGLRSDCSQWTRAIYLKAGAEDPGMNTTDQVAHGHRTTDPQPGDLVFDAPSGFNHVELYIGDGKTIGHGSPPIDEWTVDGMRAHFGGVFFVTYDFLE